MPHLPLAISTLVGLSSTSWIMLWMCLEINTVAMCWVMSKEMAENNLKNDSITKYFCIQVSASVAMLMSCFSQSLMSNMTLIMAMCMKMGVWPIHSWYLSVINWLQMKNTSMLIIMTWQKILPLMVIQQTMTTIKGMNLQMVLLITCASLVTTVIMMEKNNSVKEILGLASVNNNSWLLAAAMCSTTTLWVYLSIYSISLWAALSEMEKSSKKDKESENLTLQSFLSMMNLSGLPPMVMFWGKIIIILSLMNSMMPKELLMIMMLTACLMIYHYTWTVTNLIIMKPKQTEKMKNKKWSKMKLSIMSIGSIMGLAAAL